MPRKAEESGFSCKDLGTTREVGFELRLRERVRVGVQTKDRAR